MSKMIRPWKGCGPRPSVTSVIERSRWKTLKRTAIMSNSALVAGIAHDGRAFQSHHEQFRLGCGNLADARETFLAITILKPPTSQAVADFQPSRTQIAHKAKRAEAAADVSTDVHDEALDTTNFQLANGIVEAF